MRPIKEKPAMNEHLRRHIDKLGRQVRELSDKVDQLRELTRELGNAKR